MLNTGEKQMDPVLAVANYIQNDTREFDQTAIAVAEPINQV
jgi:hypothetical protein